MKKGNKDMAFGESNRLREASRLLYAIFERIRHKLFPSFRSCFRLIAGCLVLYGGFPGLFQVSHAKDYAMVIGISEYDYEGQLEGIRPLTYPDDDARDMAISLKEKEFTVLSLINDGARRYNIMNAFAKLRDIIKEEDTFVLYFAGHGVREVNIEHTFWLTHDTKLTSLDHNGIRLSHLMDYVSDIKASKKLVLLDHCFSGDMRFEPVDPNNSRNVDALRPGITRGALPVDELQNVDDSQSAGLAVLAAARDQAFEKPEFENGVFTEALIKAMDSRDADDNNDGKLSVAELERYLNVEVVRLSESIGSPQTPVSVVNAQGLGEWTLFQLPEVEPNAVEVSAIYKGFLARWATREPTWIDQQIKVRVYQTLFKWVSAQANSVALDLADKQAMQALKGNIDLHINDGVDEAIVAEILNQELKIIYGI